jgi:tRNA threonylcarbamoyladenosine biosynthesis protein TsaB
MPSLRQILSAHAPVLLVDAASSRIQAGTWDGSGPARWSSSEEEPVIGLFRCLDSLGVDPAQMRAFAFAEGPGSVLGIRLSAVALRMWCAIAPRPVFAYHALALLAEAAGRPEPTFIADARRGEWHCCRRGRAPWRQPAAGLAPPLATPEGFRAWTPLPPGVESVPYRVDELMGRADGADLFRPVAEPDAFLPEPPNYATWSPQIHRAAQPELPS